MLKLMLYGRLAISRCDLSVLADLVSAMEINTPTHTAYAKNFDEYI